MSKKTTETTLVKKGFIAEGTTCDSCAEIIKRQARKVAGVTDVEFDFSKEVGYVTFDKTKAVLEDVLEKIEEKGYSCFILDEQDKGVKTFAKPMGWVFGIIGFLIAAYFIYNFVGSANLPVISQNMGYGLLFAVGLLTGFHCVGMCGGFVISYTAKDAQEGRSSAQSHTMYGVGKLISYTVIGALFGLLGSFIAFTPMMRGVAGILAGLFLLIFGLRMLNIFPVLRKFSIRLPGFLNKKLSKEYKNRSSPLVIGLLNGLMIACGPLQAVYIMAAGTGSMIEGAKLLFVFAAGTLPVMLGFGHITSHISRKATHKILKASGVLVILLGLVMVNRGFALTGSGYDFNSLTASLTSNQITGAAIGTASSSLPLLNNGYQEIRMEVNRYGWEPDKFVLKKGVPVKWIVNGLEINGCNNAIQVPKYGINFDIRPGEQVIEFTPTEEGVIPWSCWMGMIPGAFVVKDNIDLNSADAVDEALNNIPVQPRGSCGGGCGNPGCGGARGGGCGCGS